MRDTSTKFPSEIDNRIFAQDISISQVPIMQEYYKLLNAGNYDMASDLLNNSEVSFYGAWVLNVLEERLHAIGDYVVSTDLKPDLVTYSDAEPSTVSEGMCWIG